MANTIEMTTSESPAREPVFTQTTQIGIVVRDLDATLRHYIDDYGIGPWTVYEITPENAPDLLHEGEPLKARTRSASCQVGSVWWEVSQPLDEHGIFARFLAEKGEGVHHIAVVTPDYHGTMAEHTRRGVTFPLSGSAAGVEVAYLPTDRTLGVLLEVFSGFPGEQPDPNAKP